MKEDQERETANQFALSRISESISRTNNGKLMIARIACMDDRDRVPELVALGMLRYAAFQAPRDSVCLPSTPPADPRETFSRPPIGMGWIGAPDYEGAILARQEAAGMYD